MDLRKVPALSNRPAPKEEIVAAFWASNNAPRRLVMTAPVLMAMLPAPVQTVVPPFSSVRVASDAELGRAALSVAPAGMIVRPLPLIVPAVQFSVLLTITIPLHSSA